MKLFSHQLLVDGKEREKPFPSRAAAVEWARTNLAAEIAKRRVQIKQVEHFKGAGEIAMQRRRDKVIRKATGFKTEAAFSAAWHRQHSKGSK